MQDITVELRALINLAPAIYELRFRPLLVDDQAVFLNLKPGQFVKLTVPGLYLRRPISVCDVSEDGDLILIIKSLGTGTKRLTSLPLGTKLKILAPLGNNFRASTTQDPVLVAGGVGLPPLYFLAKSMVKEGKKPQVVLGFRTKADVFYEQEFLDLGLKPWIFTEDGSYAQEGYCTTCLAGENPLVKADYIYACGPTPMLEALLKLNLAPGQYSLEERMACGFGACRGCTIKLKSGNKRVCYNGPVFSDKELRW